MTVGAVAIEPDIVVSLPWLRILATCSPGSSSYRPFGVPFSLLLAGLAGR